MLEEASQPRKSGPLAIALPLLRFHEREIRDALHQSIHHLRHIEDKRSLLLVDAVKMPGFPFAKVVV